MIMLKKRKPRKEAEAVNRVHPLGLELADWFWQQGQREVLGHSVIAKQIKVLLEARGKMTRTDKVKPADYMNYINDARCYLIGGYKVTIKNFRSTKQEEGGYKIADDQEATQIGEQRIRRWGLAGRGVMEMLPLMKRACLSRPIREIFSETLAGIHEIKGHAERYLSASDEALKLRREEQRQITIETEK